MGTLREAAVAGMFYPADPNELRKAISLYLEGGATESVSPPKAIIAPHAGYIYSAPVAATAYATLKAAADRIKKVILIGPSHYVMLRGLAVSSASQYKTPLGMIEIDQENIEKISGLPQVSCSDEAHQREHSLEVHLPFLQMILGDFLLTPIVAGDATADEVSEVIEKLWGGPETLIVISSDLSHYHSYETAKQMDSETTESIEHLDYKHLEFEQACGRVPISGLLKSAEKHGLTPKTTDLRNSGDTAGPKDRVVGYGAYVFN